MSKYWPEKLVSYKACVILAKPFWSKKKPGDPKVQWSLCYVSGLFFGGLILTCLLFFVLFISFYKHICIYLVLYIIHICCIIKYNTKQILCILYYTIIYTLYMHI